MVFPSHGNHSSKHFVLGIISQIGRDFGMIVSKKRLSRSLRETSKEIVKRTWLLLVIQGREKEIILARRVTVMEDHYSHERRRT
jgi:hypothetical protein